MGKKNQKKGKIVSVLNMKGGVGKTTISGNLFREVFRTKKINTLLIDIDPQFNLTQLLMTRENYEKVLDKNKTIFNVFQHEPPDSVFAVSDEYNLVLPKTKKLITPLKKIDEAQLHLLAGNFNLASLNLKGTNELSTPRKRFVRFVEQAQKEYDLIVIDCNPSTSFLTKCALEVSTHILVPVRPDKYSVIGVEMISQFIDSYLGKGKEPDMRILLNDMKDKDGAPEIASQLRGDVNFGPKVLVSELHHSLLLRAKPDYTGFAVDQKVPYKHAVRAQLVAIADEYSKFLGI